MSRENKWTNSKFILGFKMNLRNIFEMSVILQLLIPQENKQLLIILRYTQHILNASVSQIWHSSLINSHSNCTMSLLLSRDHFLSHVHKKWLEKGQLLSFSAPEHSIPHSYKNTYQRGRFNNFSFKKKNIIGFPSPR